MNVLTIDGVSKSYGIKTLFKDVNLTINDDHKTGLIGVNGTGKSTLLNVIAKKIQADAGNISYMKGIRIEFLSQNPDFDNNASVLEQVFKGDSKEIRTIRDYENIIEVVEENPEDMVAQNKLLILSETMKDLDLWDYESQVKTILTKLGVHHFDKKIGELSGGQKKRVALASALITPCDLLILDEPTNHMDNSTIGWLENYLKNRKGALLMITHDRYFLDRVVNKTIELDKGTLYAYTGNYTEFIEKKLERRELLEATEKKRQNLYRNELKWIRRGARARSTKQKARLQRFDEIKESKIDLREDELEVMVGMSRLGNKIVEVNDISKSFGDLRVVDDFSYTLLRDDRIGIIGDNGMGKSTLLNMIVGRLEPDTGLVDIGSTVKIGYFSQESGEMDFSMKAIDYIKETAEYITTLDGGYISAGQLMETFLFDSDIQYTEINRLSGGEKRRLFLLKILMGEPNILILDEPTNDLDIDTLKVLENYIDHFSGAVISVSHDRYFLDRTCQKIFAFSLGGIVDQYPGNYTDYTEKIQSDLKELSHGTNPNASKELKSGKSPKTSKAESVNNNQQIKKKKFTYKEKLEFETIYDEIEKLENRLEEIEELIKNNSSDYTMLQDLSEETEVVELELLEKLERQEYLEDIDAG